KPRLCNDCSIAFPCGSSTPRLGVMKTRARMTTPSGGADPAVHFVIGFLDAAEVLTEAILVELLAGDTVPESARVGTNLVTEEDLPVMPAEFELAVDEQDAFAFEETSQDGVDLHRHVGQRLQLGFRGHAEDRHVPLIDHRVVERITLVIVLD